MRMRPVTADPEHEEALAAIDRLMDRNPAASTAAADRLGVLATLVEAYEDHRWPIDAPDPIEAMRLWQGSGVSVGFPPACPRDPQSAV